MRYCNAFSGAALFGLGLLSGLSGAYALDARTLDKNATPTEAFRLGFNAYKQGDKTTAIEALTYAAEKGHAAAQWKLGRMYAEGDGLAKDDMKAFEMFSEIADGHADDNPDGSSARFVANAFVELGSYYREGIPNSAIKPDFGRARQMFAYAASYFGDPEAQLNLARMYYEGEGGDPDPRQAVRWAKLAATKGNVRAQALLGHMLFEGEGVGREPVLGLMYLNVARDRSQGADPWIQRLQEQAFSVATETERRTALALSDDWIAKHGGREQASAQ
ncbi:MAG: sel1 repeat family protein [Bosea sp.]|nr:sel1 repeat family protein [Bosea sp. (in: a-proteobacteria)]